MVLKQNTLLNISNIDVPIPEKKPKDAGLINWPELLRKISAMGAGAGRVPSPDWGVALGNATNALYQSDMQKAQDDYQRELMQQQNDFRELQYQNQLDQQQFQNQLAQDKFNADKYFQQQNLNLRTNPISSRGSGAINGGDYYLNKLIIPEISMLPGTENEEEKKKYREFISENYPQIDQALQSIAEYKQPIDLSKYAPIERSNFNKMINLYNPEFDETQFSRAIKLNDDIRNVDTPIGGDLLTAKTIDRHLSQFKRNVQELANNNPHILNLPLNELQRYVGLNGAPAVNNLKQTVEALASEYSRYLIRGKPTMSSIDAITQTFNEHAPVKELLSAAENLEELMDARTLSLAEIYYRERKEPIPIDLVTPSIAANLINRGWAKLSNDKNGLIPIEEPIINAVEIDGQVYENIIPPPSYGRAKSNNSKEGDNDFPFSFEDDGVYQ